MQNYWNLYLACKQQQLYGPVNYRDFRETDPWTANAHPLRPPQTILCWVARAHLGQKKEVFPSPFLPRYGMRGPHHCARPMRSKGSERLFPWLFVSDKSPRCVDREGLGRRHTRSRQSQTQTRQSSPVKNLRWNQQTKNQVDYKHKFVYFLSRCLATYKK